MKSPVTSITDEQLAELEDLCGKATQGEWWIDSHGVTMIAMDSLEEVFTTPCDPKTAVRHPETGNLSNWRNDWDASYIATACPSKVKALIARLRAAEADAKLARQRVKELDLLFGRYLLAMKASVVEAENGRGHEAAMQWIVNSLAGPGEMPPEDEPDAQAFFDREIKSINDAMAELFESRRAAMERKA